MAFVALPLQKMTLPLALVALISAFGSSFQYGYNVSVINSPAPVSGPGWEGLRAEQGRCAISKFNVLCALRSSGVPPPPRTRHIPKAGPAGPVLHPRLLHPSVASISQLPHSGFLSGQLFYGRALWQSFMAFAVI